MIKKNKNAAEIFFMKTRLIVRKNFHGSKIRFSLTSNKSFYHRNLLNCLFIPGCNFQEVKSRRNICNINFHGIRTFRNIVFFIRSDNSSHYIDQAPMDFMLRKGSGEVKKVCCGVWKNMHWQGTHTYQ